MLPGSAWLLCSLRLLIFSTALLETQRQPTQRWQQQGKPYHNEHSLYAKRIQEAFPAERTRGHEERAGALPPVTRGRAMAAGSSSALGTRPCSPAGMRCMRGKEGTEGQHQLCSPRRSQAVLPHQRPPAAATTLTLSSLRWALFSHKERGRCPQLEQPLGL